MGCVPASNPVKLITPVPLTGCGGPRLVPLSLNCTVPVGVPAAEVIVAVKVTTSLRVAGLVEDETAVVVAALAMLKDCGTLVAGL